MLREFILLTILIHCFPINTFADGRCGRWFGPRAATTPLPTRAKVVIIGAGPAGLSVAYHLRMRGLDPIILEAGTGAGESFRNMPNSLKLVSPAYSNSLLSSHSNVPTKAREYAKYLSEFAKSSGLSIFTNTRVSTVDYANSRFTIETSRGRIQADYLVSATGYFSRPWIPEISGRENSKIPEIHFANYKDPDQLRSEYSLGNSNPRVLVVGKRLSAGQAVVELTDAGFEVSLVARSKIQFTKTGQLGKALMWLGPVIEKVIAKFKPNIESLAPMQGDGAKELIRSGRVRVFPGIDRLTESTVHFKDGRKGDFDLILYATGFKPALDYLKPVLSRGSPPESLHFIGLDGLFNFRSRFIRGMREDAIKVADALRTQILDRKIVDWSSRSTGEAGVVPLDPSFDPKNEVIIGFSPTNYHTYLIAGELEFHSRLYVHKSFVRPSRESTLRGALFVRLVGLELEAVERLKEYIRTVEGKRFVSCAHGVFEVLREGAGIVLAKEDRPIERNFDFLDLTKSILENGLIARNGDPIEMQVFKTRSGDVGSIFSEIEHHSSRYRLPLLLSRSVRWVLN